MLLESLNIPLNELTQHSFCGDTNMNISSPYPLPCISLVWCTVSCKTFWDFGSIQILMELYVLLSISPRHNSWLSPLFETGRKIFLLISCPYFPFIVIFFWSVKPGETLRLTSWMWVLPSIWQIFSVSEKKEAHDWHSERTYGCGSGQNTSHFVLNKSSVSHLLTA